MLGTVTTIVALHYKAFVITVFTLTEDKDSPAPNSVGGGETASQI